MALINISNLTFAWPGEAPLFKNLSLQLDTSWKLGLVGRNGRGKTTFLQLLRQQMDYDGSINIPLFPPPLGGLEGKTTRQVARHYCPALEDWAFERETSLLKLPSSALDTPFGRLSRGEQTKVLLASLFLSNPPWLLIDEPTNHLDASSRHVVSAWLNSKQGFIVVSHDRAFLDGSIDHLLVIHPSGLELRQGNFSSWWADQQKRDEAALARNEELESQIASLKQAARRSAQWSHSVEQSKCSRGKKEGVVDKGYLGHQAAKIMKRSKALDRRRTTAADEKSQTLIDVEQTEPLKLAYQKFHSSLFLSCEGFSLRRNGRSLFAPLTLQIHQGDRLALCGTNGSGKTSFLMFLSDENMDYDGTFWKAQKLKISVVPQDSSFLQGSLSSIASQRDLDESRFKMFLRKLDVPRSLLDRPMETFSDGQKKKVLLAASLCEEAHLYLWDEPLNYIDLFSRMQIETLLEESKATILFVEHDQTFVDHIATKTATLQETLRNS